MLSAKPTKVYSFDALYNKTMMRRATDPVAAQPDSFCLTQWPLSYIAFDSVAAQPDSFCLTQWPLSYIAFDSVAAQPDIFCLTR